MTEERLMCNGGSRPRAKGSKNGLAQGRWRDPEKPAPDLIRGVNRLSEKIDQAAEA
jgi:hypothetical protein